MYAVQVKTDEDQWETIHRCDTLEQAEEWARMFECRLGEPARVMMHPPTPKAILTAHGAAVDAIASLRCIRDSLNADKRFDGVDDQTQAVWFSSAVQAMRQAEYVRDMLEERFGINRDGFPTE